MSHAGLLLNKSPRSQSGKLEDNKRAAYLQSLEDVLIPVGYADFFQRWSSAVAALPEVRFGDAVATSRTLIGHGLAAVTQVGLSLHHTYGVPYLPGSALKGMLAHYVDETLGKSDPTFRGPRLDGETGAVVSEPGENYRAMFGSAPSDRDEAGFEGLIEFHDAILDPASARPWLKADVLTPHQVEYYRDASKDPNDFTSPNPVGFVTANRALKYRVVLGGPNEWTLVAMTLLKAALAERGIGGKTTSGYGRFDLTMHLTELDRVAAAERTAREAEALARTQAEEEARRRREQQAREVPERLRSWMQQGARPGASEAELLKSASEFCKLGLLRLEVAGESLKDCPKAARNALTEFVRGAWPELGDILQAKWTRTIEVQPTLAEVPAKLWWSPDIKKGEVHARITESGLLKVLKAHTLSFGEAKFYADRTYAIELPDSESSAVSVILLQDLAGKFSGVMKP